ncbi:TPT-domain-containing protein [Suhomyces tanzawaensis NRRL Y-17324]|uniref:TPT-domain-containing protein n=1 Tax=Suhomyces tanzawaensis NRRL Y-17324 TaxID=984487 RepID=A0A1E4SHL3_9ASCO|nr:TPT-domain-containing protein [Suhomyces tanzawaensis NRRL Y-17324]ODV78912.1 TPT-domain-containing protein [Suhomyces tanzawaensis NRRL Y-17324]
MPSTTTLPVNKSHATFFSSQINPNSSSTNLSQLASQRSTVHAPRPNKHISLSNNNHFLSFQLPITPPISNASTPIREVETPASAWAFLPPMDIKITVLCISWYLVSIISNNSTKMILSRFLYPITLTQCQFLLNLALSVVLLAAVSARPHCRNYFPKGVLPNTPSVSPMDAITAFLTPTTLIISTTVPMGCFQFVGHLSSHKATLLIPVSLVHTIKALSPLITVLIYRMLFKIKYKIVTYVTLVPLIVGIMLTCYKPKKAAASTPSYYFTGLVYAFISMLIFVSQNIFAKKRLTIEKDDKVHILPTSKDAEDSTRNKKVDKLTILFYCSMIGFVFTLPIYLVAEFTSPSISFLQIGPTTGFLIVLNGVSHFLQSLLAFQILGAMSPINYSIANILKRIIIIVIAFLWENKNFTNLQATGLCLTILGLYCYDRWGTNHH